MHASPSASTSSDASQSACVVNEQVPCEPFGSAVNAQSTLFGHTVSPSAGWAHVIVDGSLAVHTRSVPTRVTVSVAVPPSLTCTASDCSANPTVDSCCWHWNVDDIDVPSQLGCSPIGSYPSAHTNVHVSGCSGCCCSVNFTLCPSVKKLVKVHCA